VSIVRVGLAETSGFAEGYEAIFGSGKKETPVAKSTATKKKTTTKKKAKPAAKSAAKTTAKKKPAKKPATKTKK
jgi:hypothetical protein